MPSRIPNADSSAQIQSLLGDIAEHQGQFKSAVNHYQKATDLNPTETNIYTLAMEFVRHWTFDPAIKIFRYGLERYPASTLLLSGKGIAEYADNHYTDAAAIFSGLLAHDPDNTLYADILGHSCNLLPDSTADCNSMIAFAEAHPSNAPASLYAAKSLLHNPVDPDATAKAEVLLHRATAINPKLAEAWYELGVLDQQKGNWQQSQTALEKCVMLQPKLSKAHYRLALAYAHLGRRREAKQENCFTAAIQ
jgi:tetratricopeptide (TPR) repeat protein